MNHPRVGDASDLFFLNSAKNAADSCFKFFGTKRFDDIVVSTEFKASNSVCYVTQGGEHHDRNIRLLAQLLADAVAVKLWHHDIQDHQIWIALFKAFESFSAVAGGYYVVTNHRQTSFQNASNTGLVVDNENGFFAGGCGRHIRAYFVLVLLTDKWTEAPFIHRKPTFFIVLRVPTRFNLRLPELWCADAAVFWSLQQLRQLEFSGRTNRSETRRPAQTRSC